MDDSGLEALHGNDPRGCGEDGAIVRFHPVQPLGMPRVLCHCPDQLPAVLSQVRLLSAIGAFEGAHIALLAVFTAPHCPTRALEIVSEASSKLSADLKNLHPQIPWKDVAGPGSIYRHDYEDVIQQRVWHTVHEALPILLAVVEAELAAGGERP